MSNADNNKDNDICANCGKGEEGSASLKACTACKKVKYCNRECQIAHRSQHKKECKKRAAELHEEALFKQPSSEYGDCPICFLRMPSLYSGGRYMPCCGKMICSGCVCAPVYDNEGNVITEETCPFCRTPKPKTNEEAVERTKQRVEAEDYMAINNIGLYYANGQFGFPQDYTKALDLWHQAGELGYTGAYRNIGNVYFNGRAVELDMKKAVHCYELAAMGGDAEARHNLGSIEGKAGNMDRALKHFMIAVNGGLHGSLEIIRNMVTNGHATKDDYTKALKSYQVYLDEIKSNQRDKAAAANEDYKYY